MSDPLTVNERTFQKPKSGGVALVASRGTVVSTEQAIGAVAAG